MRVGPNTRITLSDELKGPRDRVLIRRQAETIPFSDLDPPLQALLQGQEEGASNWEHPDILPGPEELEKELREDNALVRVTVPRSELPEGKLEIGGGLLNVDALGRELPMVITHTDGARVTLSNVACLYRYAVHNVSAARERGIDASRFASAPRLDPGAVLEAHLANHARARTSMPTAQGSASVNSEAASSAPQPVGHAKPNRLGDALIGQLATLLGKGLSDAANVEVRTYTSEAGAPALPPTGDPLASNVRLRAYTRLAIDGGTQICIPLRASGEPDDALWKLHSEAVAQARADRDKAIASTIAALKALAGN